MGFSGWWEFLDDDLRQNVSPVYARPGWGAIRGQMGLGHSFPGRPRSAGHFSRILRGAAPGSGVWTFRARAVGAVPGTSSGVPGAAAFSDGHRAGELHAVGAAAGAFRQRV